MSYAPLFSDPTDLWMVSFVIFGIVGLIVWHLDDLRGNR